jgi:3-oxoacyl-[acyl-carrier protein] reductase
MDLGIAGQVALVTGGSMGIGKATAAVLAREGVHVALCARNKDRLQQAADEVARAAGVKTAAAAADCTRADDVKRMVGEVAARFGRIDILVNSAGAAKAGPFTALTDADWLESLDLKLLGTMRVTREVFPLMQRQRGGRILVVIGTFGQQPSAWATPAGAANSGLVNFVKAVAEEGAKDGILVNGISPGLVNTGRFEYLVKKRATDSGVSEQEARQSFIKPLPLGRIIEPEEVGAAAAFLCSRHAGYITGTVLCMDGGTIKGI